MNTQLLADTIAHLDEELLNEVIKKHYKITMTTKNPAPARFRATIIAVAAALAVISITIPIGIVSYNNHLNSIDPSYGKYMPIEQYYACDGKSSFAQILIERVYDGVYGNSGDHYLLAECIVIDDCYGQLVSGTKLLIRFHIVKELISRNETVGFVSDGEDAPTQKSMFEIVFDDSVLYRDFLSEYCEALVYFRAIDKAKEIYETDVDTGESLYIAAEIHDKTTMEDENVYLMCSDCTFTDYCFIPLKDGRVRVSALEQFLKKSLYPWEPNDLERSMPDFYILFEEDEIVAKIKANLRKQ